MNVHEWDQMRAGLNDLSTILWDQYQRLIKLGFSGIEALHIVIALQRDLVSGNKK